MRIHPIRRLQNLDSADFASQHVRTNVPVVLEGALKGWKASTLWSADYLKSQLADASFLYRVSASNMHPHDPRRPDLDDVGFGNVADYLEALNGEEGARRYLTGEQTLFLNKGVANPQLAPIAGDFSIPTYIPQDALRYVGFWLSAKGTVSWLHYDGNGCDNLNAQVVGRKRAMLFSPEHGDALNPLPSSELGGSNFSQLDVRTLAQQGPPGLACYETELGPGDLLFIPAFWWHSFSHLDPLNVNVNFWWARQGTQFNATTLQWAYTAALQRALAANREGLPLEMLRQSLDQLGPAARALVERLQTEMMRTLLKDPDL
jgi:hypothetical protein